MEYSLNDLNQSSDLNNINLKELVEDLNLIGFEVDNVFEDTFKVNSFYKNFRLLLKIPANREDLLTEHLLTKELSDLFNFKKKELWKTLQPNYSNLLKFQYSSSLISEKYPILSQVKNIILYNIELENFEQFSSPLWLQEKLKNFGKIVQGDIRDLTELINLEWGNSYLYYLNKKQINSSFTIELLSEETYLIDDFNTHILIPKNMIVLKNEKNQIKTCLGYFPTLEIIEENKKINIQFSFYDIHANPLNLNFLNSSFSSRLLRKSFLENFRFGIQRFLTLIKILNPNKAYSIKLFSTINSFVKLKQTKIIKLKKLSSLYFLNLLTYDETIFKKAGLKLVAKTKKDFYFQVPNTRKDLNREIDLIEEYSRFIGYKNCQEIIPLKNPIRTIAKQKSYKYLRNFFVNLGFNEVIHRSIEENKKEKEQSILLNNPLNNDFFLLRTELSSKIIETFENNNRLGFLENNFFEMGRVFKKINGKLIEEDRFSAIFKPLFGNNNTTFSEDWYINKGFLESLLSIFGYNKISFYPIEIKNSTYHPTRSFLIKQENSILGIFGEVNPFNLNINSSIYLMELNLLAFQDSQVKTSISFLKEFSKYPTITKDISIQISKSTNFVNLYNFIEKIVTNLKTFYIFDIYFSDLQTEKINIGLRFEFQSNTITLTSQEIDDNLRIIKEKLIDNFDVLIL